MPAAELDRRGVLAAIAASLGTLPLPSRVAAAVSPRLLATAMQVRSAAAAGRFGDLPDSPAVSIGLGARDDDETARRRARLFLAGSVLALGNIAGAHPLVGFYNPVVDGWWLTRWNADARIEAAAFAVAPLFGDDRHDWRLLVNPAGLRRSFIETVRGGSAAALNDWRSQIPMQGRDDIAMTRLAAGGDDVPVLAARIDAAAAGLRAFRASAGAVARYRAMADAIAAGAPDAVGVTGAGRLGIATASALPVARRAPILPVGAVLAEATWLIASAMPGTAHGMLLAALTDTEEHGIVRTAYATLFQGEPL